MFDHENEDPKARGNVTNIFELSSPLSPSPSREILRATYEPKFNKIRAFRDASGAVTEFIYDHDVSPSGSGTGLIVELRRPAVTRPDGTKRKTFERFKYNQFGQLIKHSGLAANVPLNIILEGLSEGYLKERSHSFGVSNVFENFE